MKNISLNLVASQGISMGRIFIPAEPNLNPDTHQIDTSEAEAQTSLFISARDSAIEQYQDIMARSDKAASIFRAHIDMSRSSSLVNSVLDKIKNENKNAQLALKETEYMLVARFGMLDDPYIRERAADVKDIAARIMAIMKGVSLKEFNVSEDSIVISRELTPSDTSRINFSLVKGFITELGGATSHTSIIARNNGIPAAVGQQGILDIAKDAGFIILDADASLAILNPDEKTIEFYKNKIEQKNEANKSFDAEKHLPAITPDGRRIEVFANAGGINDIKAALKNGASGIGLFRTEFLYMESGNFPSEDEQFRIYKECALICAEKPLIVRTLDIGGDKNLPYFDFPKEENPFLGWRAIRMTLEMEEVFKPQMRALLRASHYGNIQIMYPMIISIAELRQANALLEGCKAELAAEGLEFNKNIQTGIMIETPAAALMAEELAEEAAFFSIGTNDLTQYILAVDRGNEKIAPLYDPFHPAVLRAISHVIKAGHKHGKMVGMCGEFASDKNATLLLLEMGLAEFSVSPTSIPELKHRIRNSLP